MEAQRDRARAGAAFTAGDEGETTAVYQRLSSEIPSVDFVGYDTVDHAGAHPGDGARRAARAGGDEGDEVEVILDRTPAYAESGGQVGDTGTLVGRQGRGEILDTYYAGTSSSCIA